jgi:hypothetical protein
MAKKTGKKGGAKKAGGRRSGGGSVRIYRDADSGAFETPRVRKGRVTPDPPSKRKTKS